MSDVADLLTRSRAAHARYYQHHQVWDAGTKTWGHGNLTEARRALQEALELRCEALSADPIRDDPAWREDKASHADLIAFYEGRLASADL